MSDINHGTIKAAAELQTFIDSIAAEEFLPLPKPLPEEPDEDFEWEDIESRADADRRIWSGKAAEVLFREFEFYAEERTGWGRKIDGGTRAAPWWLYCEEALFCCRDGCLLFWSKDGGLDGRHFARLLTREECDTLLRLAEHAGVTITWW
jgi:hypothetical protein